MVVIAREKKSHTQMKEGEHKEFGIRLTQPMFEEFSDKSNQKQKYLKDPTWLLEAGEGEAAERNDNRAPIRLPGLRLHTHHGEGATSASNWW